MRILHYFLGWERSGGLNRYARDLALTQSQAGDEVLVLYPAGGILQPSSASIVAEKIHSGVQSFALKGGVPVPLLEGVCNPRMMTEPQRRLTDAQCDEFVKELRPDVVHIHTWMGFPSELLPRFKAFGSKIVFTTHDYYGLCPKVNFVDTEGLFCTDCSNERCSRCNAGAPNERFLRVRNWEFLMRFKKWLKPLLGVRKKHQGQACRGQASFAVQDYMSLQTYYLSLLRQCNVIHCNSQVSRGIYERYLPDGNYVILPITHDGIQWSPRMKPVNPECIRIGFSGPAAPFKGLPLLLEVLKEIPAENWHLDIWGTGERKDEGRVSWRGNYAVAEEAFRDLDILIVPSVCGETFGFIVPEALSLGVPVLCSDMVGAQLLVKPEMVYHGKEGLKEKIMELLRQPERLEAAREKLVCDSALVPTMAQHAIEMRKLYKR